MLLPAYWALVAAAAYCLGQLLSVGLRCPPINMTPLWLPLGLIVGIFAATERKRWGWLSLGTFIAGTVSNLAIGFNLAGSAWAGLFLPLAAATTAVVVNLQPGFRGELTLRRLVALILVGSASFELLVILPFTLLGIAAGIPVDFGTFFIRLTVNAPLNMVMVVPVVMACMGSGRFPAHKRRSELAEAAVVIAILAFVSFFAFSHNDWIDYRVSMALLPLPLLLLLALRSGTAATSAGLLVVTLIAFFQTSREGGPFAIFAPIPRILTTQLAMLALGGPLVLLASVVEERRKATENLRMLAIELTSAEARQRRVVAAVLHNEITQSLFAVSTQLLVFRDRQEKTPERIEKVMAMLDRASHNARNLTCELSPPLLCEAGLAPAVKQLAQQFTEEFGIPCVLEGDTRGPEDLDLRSLAFQAVRELVNNSVKHARPRSIRIELAEAATWIDVTVTDDGVGFDTERLAIKRDSFGLFYLRERLKLLGGHMLIRSSPGNGCSAKLRIPMHAMTPIG